MLNSPIVWYTIKVPDKTTPCFPSRISQPTRQTPSKKSYNNPKNAKDMQAADITRLFNIMVSRNLFCLTEKLRCPCNGNPIPSNAEKQEPGKTTPDLSGQGHPICALNCWYKTCSYIATPSPKRQVMHRELNLRK